MQTTADEIIFGKLGLIWHANIMEFEHVTRIFIVYVYILKYLYCISVHISAEIFIPLYLQL